jgi:hypothetical protein
VPREKPIQFRHFNICRCRARREEFSTRCRRRTTRRAGGWVGAYSQTQSARVHQKVVRRNLFCALVYGAVETKVKALGNNDDAQTAPSKMSSQSNQIQIQIQKLFILSSVESPERVRLLRHELQMVSHLHKSKI